MEIAKIFHKLFDHSRQGVIISLLLFACLTPACSAPLRVGNQWTKGQHVVVDSDAPQDVVQSTITKLDIAVNDYRHRFPEIGKLDRPLVVRLFHNREAYQIYGKQYGRGFNPNSNGYYRQATKPKEREVVFFYRKNGGHLWTAIHELWHHYLHSGVDQIGYMPRWFNEGIAEYLERSQVNELNTLNTPNALNPGWRNELRIMAKGSKRIPLRTLMSMDHRKWNNKDFRFHFATSYCLIHYIMTEDKQAETALRQLLLKLTQGITYDEALKHSFADINLKQLEKSMYAWLNKKLAITDK